MRLLLLCLAWTGPAPMQTPYAKKRPALFVRFRPFWSILVISCSSLVHLSVPTLFYNDPIGCALPSVDRCIVSHSSPSHSHPFCSSLSLSHRLIFIVPSFNLPFLHIFPRDAILSHLMHMPTVLRPRILGAGPVVGLVLADRLLDGAFAHFQSTIQAPRVGRKKRV